MDLNVRDQYNRYPYPHFNWLAKAHPLSSLHASFETGSALTLKKFVAHENRKVALFGCGTFEPYVMGAAHPLAKIDAVDISGASLSAAKKRCALRRVSNVEFHEQDLVAFAATHACHYDYIHAYGVLHHLEDAAAGFTAVARCLRKSGFARIMVYSLAQRRRVNLLRNAIRALGLSHSERSAIKDVRQFIAALPWNHPLKITAELNEDNKTDSGLVDALLHARETSFTIDELLKIVDDAGLVIRAWDFSKSLHSLVDSAGDAMLEDKIRYLEAFDQWPGPFTFWAVKKEDVPPQMKLPILTVHPWIKKGDEPFRAGAKFHSALHRGTFALSASHAAVLNLCRLSPTAEAGVINSLSRDGYNGSELAASVRELQNARFLMETSR